ncbi:DNA mismatch repair protein MutS [Antarcticirhabdus aurantiaca]|uniref:DNA mismatch repair protein MutS n=1 Tax=Antarcticirhabdus aurantiaca TaxID=2606717 RepID=A0ACD4NQF1_9HYPH|nr:DNA mismatch repair protein MutS [Antarcticirhabdus aurantiaca]WAJ29062.1 DNA mismatch repair protein MutS [Jeongeuplla avenae]
MSELLDADLPDGPSKPAPPAAAAPTPMMAQYIEIKAANPDCLLFYRMGDFYELFFEDAAVAAQALGIQLTKRGKHLGEDIPMAGVPVANADDYLRRLISLGHRVAVCEQIEDPAEAKKRGAKSVVKRDVVRLVTPGTITEEALLEPGRVNALVALARLGPAGPAAEFALAWTDLSTGSFETGSSDLARLGADLARLDPSEIVMADPVFADPEVAAALGRFRAIARPEPASLFDGATAGERVARFFGVATLDGFGDFPRAELSAAAALLAYLGKTQLAARPALSRPRRHEPGAVMLIDAATRASLELTRTTSGRTAGSLLSVIDRTLTGAGARLLAARLAAPLTDTAAIAERQGAVARLHGDGGLRTALRAGLKSFPDIERAVGRLALGRGGPRDLGCLREALSRGRLLADILGKAGDLPAETAEGLAALLALPETLAAELDRLLADDLPLLAREGGLVAAGAIPQLDEARALADDTRRVIAALQARYAQETGLRSLKIRHNNVLGYFVEVPEAQGPGLMGREDGTRFTHRQTLASAMRFSTLELSELETRIAGAGAEALRLELDAFAHLSALAVAQAEPLKAGAAAVAALDVAAGLAELASAEDWSRPSVDDSLAFRIEGGRHPVVEAALRASGSSQRFVSNDCDLSPPAGASRAKGRGAAGDAGAIWLLTGPNMGGKSTFLRQNALIAVLAQIGAFVPAKHAHIGVVDRLFSRVGASDDLAEGRSTFMVEMVETAAILNQAGPRALVILDEIGRGTATYDGLSIAFASAEHLHEANRCRALFATHFHEMTVLATRMKRVRNATMRVKEWEGEVIFLHEVVPGVADRSYGIQVARLAGLPAVVVERARTILNDLERSERGEKRGVALDELPLFSALAAAPAPTPAPPPARTDPLRPAIDALDPDTMTPREALEALYRLKGLARDGVI